MGAALSGNAEARARVLSRVQEALRVEGDRSAAAARADAYVLDHRQGPRPALTGDPVARFVTRATDMASTVERLSDVSDIPGAVARYVKNLELAPALASHHSLSGVCWPELAVCDWAGAGLSIEPRPTQGDDRLGITGCFCAIAETGTLVFTTAASTPTATFLLPDTHVAVVRTSRIVPGMEEAFALIRREHPVMPRAINLVSGPSRTGDIEQTIVLGAHGPYRLHVLLID